MSTTETLPFPTRAFALVALAAVVLAAGGYAITGSPRFVSKPPQVAQQQPSQAQIEQMVEGLAQRLKQEPDNLEGWTMLGRSYLVMGRPADAVVAFRHVLERKPGDAGAMADVAGALAASNGQRMTDEALALVQRALAAESDNLKALSLAGSSAFERQDYATAVKHWERIVALSPTGADYLPQVQAGIDEARRRGGLAGGKPPVAAAGASVSGRVTLSAALRAQASPEDTVFVFARAAEGPRMPLAIVRKQVKDLPFDFVLDDSTAMSPQLRLSSVPQVVVGARISRSGNAMPQAGDLQGQSAPVAPGAKGLAVEIREVVGR